MNNTSVNLQIKVTIVTIYFYITLHDLIRMNIELSWKIVRIFSIIQALILVL